MSDLKPSTIDDLVRFLKEKRYFSDYNIPVAVEQDAETSIGTITISNPFFSVEESIRHLQKIGLRERSEAKRKIRRDEK